jgi:hypothetical protein
MTFNTGNPIGSTDARDRSDNSENLDLAVNSLSQTFVDRLGRTRDTLEGIYQKSAYYRAGTFGAGYTLTNNRQTLAYGNVEYSWSGAFPKVVSAGSTPATSGGVGAGAWVDRTDVTLRSQINIVVKRFNSVADMVNDASLSIGQIVSTFSYYDGELSVLRKPLSGNKYIIVAGGTETHDGGAFINLANGLQAKGLFPEGVNVCQFGAVGAFGNTTDSTLFFQRAMNFVSESVSSNSNDTPTCKGGRVFIPSGYYNIGNLTWRAYVNLQGEHSSTTFLHPLTGATGYMFKNTLDTDLPRAIEISGFTIAPTRNVAVESATKPAISAFKMALFQQQCLVRDIKIYNINGVGLDLQGSQDIEIENVEIRFVTTPLNLDTHIFPDQSGHNWTNAIKFIACRFENSGESQLVHNRSTHFVACKFEEANIKVFDPMGLDFIGCDWAIKETYAITVVNTATGTGNRGLRIVGGTVETGLTNNTAKFITSPDFNVHLIGLALNGMAASAIYGNVTVTDCHFSNCVKPYVTQTSRDASFINNNDYSPALGSQNIKTVDRPYDYNASAIIPNTLVKNTWYLNTSMKPIFVFLKCSYNTTSSGSTFEIKVRPDEAGGFSVGFFTHPIGSGSGTDTLSVLLLPGEGLHVNWNAGGTDCASVSFYR